MEGIQLELPFNRCVVCQRYDKPLALWQPTNMHGDAVGAERWLCADCNTQHYRETCGLVRVVRARKSRRAP